MKEKIPVSMVTIFVASLVLLAFAPTQAAAGAADFERTTCPGPGDVALEEEVAMDDYKQCKEDVTREHVIESVERVRGPIQAVGNIGDTLQDSQFEPVRALRDYLIEWSNSQEQRLDEELEAAAPS